jgi:hypothetical protein
LSASTSLGLTGPSVTASLSKTFNDDLKGQVDLSSRSALHVKLKRRLKNGLSVSPDFRWAGDSLEVGLTASKELVKSVRLTAGAKVNCSSAVDSSLQLALGLKLRFSKLSCIRYAVETRGSELRLVTTVQRGGLRLSIPLLLSQFLTSKALCFAVIGTGILSLFTKKLLDIFKQSDAKRDKASKRQAERNEKIGLAQAFCLIVKDRVDAKLEEERARDGLEIISAQYGSMAALQSHTEGEVLDVTVPLQFLVQDSKLELPAVSKAGMNGFYKLHEEPWLVIKYRCGGVVHEEWYEDTAAVSLSKLLNP